MTKMKSINRYRPPKGSQGRRHRGSRPRFSDRFDAAQGRRSH